MQLKYLSDNIYFQPFSPNIPLPHRFHPAFFSHALHTPPFFLTFRPAGCVYIFFINSIIGISNFHTFSLPVDRKPRL